MTWLFRLGGFLMMFFGVKAMLGVVVALANILPFLGGLADFGTSLIGGAVAVPCALVTIALAWIAYRPMIGVTLLVIGVVVTVGLLRKGKSDRMVTLA